MVTSWILARKVVLSRACALRRDYAGVVEI